MCTALRDRHSLKATLRYNGYHTIQAKPAIHVCYYTKVPSVWQALEQEQQSFALLYHEVFGVDIAHRHLVLGFSHHVSAALAALSPLRYSMHNAACGNWSWGTVPKSHGLFAVAFFLDWFFRIT